MNDYISWLKELLTGRGHANDVVTLVNEFLRGIDHEDWQILGTEKRGVDDFEAVNQLFTNHAELEDAFHVFVENFLDNEVEKAAAVQQIRRGSIKKRMSLLDIPPLASQLFEYISSLLLSRERVHEILDRYYPNGLLEQQRLKSFRIYAVKQKSDESLEGEPQ